jgi:hypothetical protein
MTPIIVEEPMMEKCMCFANVTVWLSSMLPLKDAGLAGGSWRVQGRSVLLMISDAVIHH